MPGQDNEVAALERELAAAQADQSRAFNSDAAPVARISSLRYRLDLARSAKREADAAALARSAATVKTAAEVAAALEALRDARRQCRTPLEAAAFDERHGSTFAVLIGRADELAAAERAPAPPAANPARDAAVAADRATFRELQGRNPLTAAQFAERRPWVAEGTS